MVIACFAVFYFGFLLIIGLYFGLKGKFSVLSMRKFKIRNDLFRFVR